jgi:hypothetical protein
MHRLGAWKVCAVGELRDYRLLIFARVHDRWDRIGEFGYWPKSATADFNGLWFKIKTRRCPAESLEVQTEAAFATERPLLMPR